MKLFGQIVRTVVNTALIPVAVVQDVLTLGGAATGKRESYTRARIETLKDEAQED